MVDVIKKGALLLMNQKCYDNYFLEYNFLDVSCFKALLSKGLGIGIIAGSVLVKVPQVLKILNSKSGEGINLMGVMLDLLAITFHMSYNFMNGYPFSSWGDNTFLAIQTVAIAALVLYFGGRKPYAFIFVVAYAILLYILNSGLTSMKVLFAIQSCNIPILLVGKLSQAVTNYRAGSTGQLSAATVIMMFAGSVARIFTSIQETGDTMIIITFVASTFANGVIFSQLLYYWNKPVGGAVKRDAPKVKKVKTKKDD
ncbi:PREDICTED: mannose-P-dolichol utilization defect 1 protein homolog [Drosophila arizonae]|uniref:Mannose-P-dolichol utilization defect 1 protein homolog n=1 Tax=Drosophila arizonae TaxID=7263 RepID=A0ABM1NZH1_DROAR|nr:PREDICTED: mannose-P-dolichol utilization defect 1 protein homolog [Drosophila arizonae]